MVSRAEQSQKRWQRDAEYETNPLGRIVSSDQLCGLAAGQEPGDIAAAVVHALRNAGQEKEFVAALPAALGVDDSMDGAEVRAAALALAGTEPVQQLFSEYSSAAKQGLADVLGAPLSDTGPIETLCAAIKILAPRLDRQEKKDPVLAALNELQGRLSIPKHQTAGKTVASTIAWLRYDRLEKNAALQEARNAKEAQRKATVLAAAALVREGLTNTQIAQRLNVPRTTVNDLLRLYKKLGLQPPLPERKRGGSKRSA